MCIRGTQLLDRLAAVGQFVSSHDSNILILYAVSKKIQILFMTVLSSCGVIFKIREENKFVW